jgi:hypothetical protein
MIGEHDGVGVLGASTYDAKRGEEWIKAHITLKRCSDITTYQLVSGFADKYQTRMVAAMGFWEQV